MAVITSPHIPAIDVDSVESGDSISPMLDFIHGASGGRLLATWPELPRAPVGDVVREAVSRDGEVSDITWRAAGNAGWTSKDLAETYGYLALVSYCDRFARYAQTDFDVVAAAAG